MTDTNDLDALKKQWRAHGDQIDAVTRINFTVAAARLLRRTDRAMLRFTAGAAIDLAFAVALIAGLLVFLVMFIGEWRFALPALLLLGLLVMDARSLIRQLILARRVDHSETVAATQKAIERLCVARIRYTRWLFVLVLLMWTPLLIVGARMLGVDIYRIAAWPFLLANFALGLAAIPIGLWFAKAFSERAAGSPWMQRVMRDLAGSNLNAAAKFSADLARFERE